MSQLFWVAVDVDGVEFLFSSPPSRYETWWCNGENVKTFPEESTLEGAMEEVVAWEDFATELPSGSIKQLTGKSLTWDDDAISITIGEEDEGRSYCFEFVFVKINPDGDTLTRFSDQLSQAGFTNSALMCGGGIPYLSLREEAGSLEGAIATAMEKLNSIPFPECRLDHIQIDPVFLKSKIE